jgi:hypothetical protein
MHVLLPCAGVLYRRCAAILKKIGNKTFKKSWLIYTNRKVNVD